MPQPENELVMWDARIQRANELASAYPFASEGLRFYERLDRFQKSLYAEIKAECGNDKRKRRAGTLRDEFDASILLPRFAAFVSALEEIAPSPLARAAHELRSRGSGRWQGILQEFWERDSAGGEPQRPEELVS